MMHERPGNPLAVVPIAGGKRLDRRHFAKLIGAMSASATALTVAERRRGTAAFAQDAAGEPIKSITREEYKQQLQAAFPSVDNPPQGGTVILGDITDVGSTNYMLGSDEPTNPVMSMVQQSLFTNSPVDGQFVPLLADSWEISADGLTYTFFLNQQATWHDGTDFTADDVIFSFDAQSNPDTGSSYTGSFVSMVDSYRKVDDHTVEMIAKNVVAPVVFFGATVSPIVPKHIWESVPFADWANDPGSTGQDPARVVGTGPFKFQEWVQGERLVLVRHDDYWDDVPNIDEFIFQVWPDDTTAIEALRAGDIDIFVNVPASDIESLRAEANTEVAIYDTYDFGFYGFNLDPTKTPLFQEREVRQALLYAMDRQAIVDNIQLGYAEVAEGSQAVLSIAYAPDQIRTHYTFDPAQATALLDQAGWTDQDGDGIREKDGVKLAFSVMYPAGISTYDQEMAFVQEAWQAIGVEMTPNPVDFGAVLIPAITSTFEYEVVRLGFSWDTTGDQSAMFNTDQYKVGFNMMKYSNPAVDEINLQAQRELDPEKRVELLIESANLVNDDLPIAVVSFGKDKVAYSTRLKNYNPNDYGGAVWLWPLPYLYVEEA